MGSCIHCGHSTLRECPQFGRFRRITSDCRPWPSGGHLGICEHCAMVQKPITAEWTEECRRIYSDYDAYHQGNGAEQAVFQTDGFGLGRSRALLAWVFEALPTHDGGHLLDFGCGGGHLLATMSDLHPSWRLSGTDLGDQHRARIEAIPRVERYHQGSLDQLPGAYHLITAVHVVEHLDQPSAILQGLASHLVPEGAMVLEVPNLRANPFDLLIADHISHFTAASLQRLLRACGLEGTLREDVVPREISAFVQPVPPGARPSSFDPGEAPEAIHSLVDRHLAWLQSLLTLARRLTEGSQPLALMGSSIAAGWLAGELEGKVTCFVDEDPNRVGGSFLGRPILAPEQLPRGTTLLAPMVPTTAAVVAARLSTRGISCEIPPAW